MSDLTPRTSQSDPSSTTPRRRVLPMIVLGLALVAGGVVVTQFLRSAVDYYCNVDEIGARSGCDEDQRLRLQGVVERGSVTDLGGGDTAFSIAFNGASVRVVYDGEPGGIFKECIPVVVHGNFDTATDTFHGDRVEVKHSDEYVSVNDDRLDEADALADACDAGSA